MRVGVHQAALAGMTPEQRIERLAAACAAADVDLMLCPELFLTGYAAPEDIRRYAEAADGPSARRIAEIARRTRTAIVYGYAETAGGALYNAARGVDAVGAARANHRKLALPPGFERALFTPGESLSLFEISGLRLGLAICYDAEFPETLRALAEAGAQAALVPTALAEEWRVVSERVMPARAFENGVFLLYANHAGAEGETRYLGESCVIGPDGRDLARAGSGDELLTAALDPARVAAAQSRLPYLIDSAPLRARLAPD
ncbi:MAG: nitrilase-related carbon-nitrogen hydrolase [Pseudomonadota bacterium]